MFAGVDGNGSFFGTGLTPGDFAGKVLAHGMVGGVMSVLQGGKFGHGFAAAGVSQSFAGKINGMKSQPARVATSAAIGGTVSEMTGGKFGNGATTAAFGRLFNEGMHEAGQKGQVKDFAWAKKQLSDRGLVPDEVLNDPEVLQDHTNKAAVLSTDGKFKVVDSWASAEKRVSGGGWSHVEGTHSAGVMKIYMGATRAGFEDHVGLMGLQLTGSQNLVQTIYHEYMHYSGVAGHGSNSYSLEYKMWGRTEGKALGGWIGGL